MKTFLGDLIISQIWEPQTRGHLVLLSDPIICDCHSIWEELCWSPEAELSFSHPSFLDFLVTCLLLASLKQNSFLFHCYSCFVFLFINQENYIHLTKSIYIFLLRKKKMESMKIREQGERDENWRKVRTHCSDLQVSQRLFVIPHSLETQSFCILWFPQISTQGQLVTIRYNLCYVIIFLWCLRWLRVDYFVVVVVACCTILISLGTGFLFNFMI